VPSGIFSKRPQRGIVVELFGLPGSGKTFLTQELTQILQKGPHSVLDFRRSTSPQFYLQDRIPRLSATWIKEQLSFRLWIFANPIVACQLWRQLSKSQQPDRNACRNFFRSWIKTLVRLRRAVESYDIVLMDQGFLQFLWTVGYESQSPQWPDLRRHLLRLMPVPDAVILVDASHATASRRLTARPGTMSRVERDGPGSNAVMQHASKLTDELRHDLATPRDNWGQTAFYPINNDTDASPAAALASIADRLLRHPSNAPIPAHCLPRSNVPRPPNAPHNPAGPDR
jgi:thymidylate kinase